MSEIYECIDVRISDKTGFQPKFILELYCEATDETVIKFFNCNSSTKGIYKVGKNYDFAKIYRLVFGKNPIKYFSKAHQLLGHFAVQRQRFFVEHEVAIGKNGKRYLRATDIKPENPIKCEEWTSSGTLKKNRQNHKPSKRFVGYAKTLEATNPLVLKPISITCNKNIDGEEERSRIQVRDSREIRERLAGDNKSLQTAKTLGLEANSNHIKTYQPEKLTTKKADNLQAVLPKPKILDSDQEQNILEFYEERAGILEFDGGLSRSDAEAQAREITQEKFDIDDCQLTAILF